MHSTTVEREGQPYVDEPIYVFPKPESKIAISVAVAFGGAAEPRSPIVVRHERVRLKWVKP